MQHKRRQLLIGAGGALLSGWTGLPANAALPTTRTLVAAYFGGWRVIMDKSQRGVHGDNPWATYPTPTLPQVNHNMKAYPGRFPLIGDPATGYDESQQWVIDKEISIASTYGIDVFAMNWYRDEFLNHPTVNYKSSPNKGQMRFFLQWSNTANMATMPSVAYTREYFFEGMRRAALHMKDPAYWRLNGLPVFSIFDMSHIDRIINATAGRGSDTSYVFADLAQATNMHDAFLQDCHNVVANVLAGDNTGGISGSGNTAVVRNGSVTPGAPSLAQMSGNFTPSMFLMVGTGDVGAWARCATVRGMYLYNIRRGTFNGVTRLTHSYDEMMQACQQNYDLVIPALINYAPGKIWWPTVMSGFDQRPWGGTAADPLHDKSFPTIAQFDTHCRQVRAVLDAYPTVTANTAFIYAWNELGEGGYITPTADTQYSRLISLRDRIKI